MQIRFEVTLSSAAEAREFLAAIAGENTVVTGVAQEAPAKEPKTRKKAADNAAEPTAPASVPVAPAEVDPLAAFDSMEAPAERQYTVDEVQDAIRAKLQQNNAFGPGMKKILTNLGVKAATELTPAGCNSFMEQLSKL
jgi:hypothetical protein